MPPPSVNAIAIVGLIAGVLFTAWSAYADRHREPVTTQEYR
jgi:hypothetical protein